VRAAKGVLGTGDGTRLTVVVPTAEGGVRTRLEKMGFRVLRQFSRRAVSRECGAGATSWVRPASDVSVLWAGRRRSAPPRVRLDRELSREHMDPIDAGREPKEPGERKHERSWTPIRWEPERWVGKGLPEEVVSMMTEGVRVEGPHVPAFYEIPQYEWESADCAIAGGIEADRAIAVGACEYVPVEMIDEVLTDCVVHPWLIVFQGPDKVRACQDYKNGTNLFNESPPFHLPSVWEARNVVQGGSHFAKYDLRDGFWHVPVHPESRRRLLVRHPTNGRLMWASRLPFGYLRSPERFCLLTQSIADLFHRRHPDLGVHVYCFVDDYLLIGRDEASTEEGCRRFEELLAELGVHWAPHKRHGPARVMEFLGLLLCNVEGMRCVALTEGREAKLGAMIGEWMARRPRPGQGRLQVEPVEMAKLLGHLIFASQVVAGGRVAMQAMLSSFKGMEVDWHLGRVRPTQGGTWGLLKVEEGFWRDLEWWEDHLSERACVPLEEEPLGVAVVSGTDASNWGYGNLVWLDGHRSEEQLKFTAVERSKPINWRELLGIVRIVQTWAEDLRGSTLLVESDNMCAVQTTQGMKSKAADMQELVRRLLAVCEEHSINLRATHTPGEKLHRPDQTSRGDAAEEPRQRLTRAEFSVLEARFGPFGEFLGSERRFARRGTTVEGARPSLWMHPAHHTVASAFRLVADRLRDARGAGVDGVILVPWDEHAAWWPLTKHFVFEGSLPAGSPMEENRLGLWHPVASQRETAVFSLSRRAGGRVQRVQPVMGALPTASAALPLLADSLVMGEGEAGRWRLYVVVASIGTPQRRRSGTVVLAELLVPIGRGGVARESATVVSVRPPPAVATHRLEGLWSVGGSLVSCATRSGRRGTDANRVYTVAWRLACEMATAARESEAGSGKLAVPMGISVPVVARCVRPDCPCPASFDGRPGEHCCLRCRHVGPCASAFHQLPGQAPALCGPEVAVEAAPASPEEVSEQTGVCAECDDEEMEVAVALAAGSEPQTPVQRGRGSMFDAVFGGLSAVLRATPHGLSEEAASASGGAAPVGGASSEGIFHHVLRTPHALSSRGVDGDTGASGLEADLEGLRLEETYPAFEGPAPLFAPGTLYPEVYDEEGYGPGGAYEPFTGGAAPSGVPPSRARVGVAQTHVCKQRSLMCEGCDQHIRPGTRMRAGRQAWVHHDEVCLDEAVRRHDAKVSLRASQRHAPMGEAKGKAPARSKGGYELVARKQSLENTFSAERIDTLVLCMGGLCGCAEPHDLMCVRACGRGLHSSCAGLGKGSALGTLVCAECRLHDLRATVPASEQVMRMAGEQSMMELTLRKETTARGHLSVEKMQQNFLDDVLKEGGSMAKPVDNPAAMAALLLWIVKTGRGSQLDSFLVACAGYMVDTSRDNLFEIASVKRAVKKVKDINPGVAQPVTSGTRLLAKRTIETIPRLATTEFLAKREKFMFSTECVMGTRIGELAGAQVGHGVFANHYSLIEWRGEFENLEGVKTTWDPPPGVVVGEKFCEHDNETSKTDVPRVMCVVGKTRGVAAIDLAGALEEYWEVCGFTIVESVEGGWKVRRPDFWVVQIGLQALRAHPQKLARLADWLGASRVKAVSARAGALQGELLRLLSSADPVENKMFLNVLGGAEKSEDVRRALAELAQEGIVASLVPGPLLMKTKGRDSSELGNGGSLVLHAHADFGEVHVRLHAEGDHGSVRRDQRGGRRPGARDGQGEGRPEVWASLVATASSAAVRFQTLFPNPEAR